MNEPYDVYAKLEDRMGILSVALGEWEDRDSAVSPVAARVAASRAMKEIDAMLAELHAMRARLVSEIRASDAAADARADDLLARHRGDGERA